MHCPLRYTGGAVDILLDFLSIYKVCLLYLICHVLLYNWLTRSVCVSAHLFGGTAAAAAAAAAVAVGRGRSRSVAVGRDGNRAVVVAVSRSRVINKGNTTPRGC